MITEQLFKAISDKNVKKVEECLRKGISVDSKNQLGETALHVAAVCGDLDIIKTLVEKGAQVNAQDEDGWTHLFHTVIESNVECTNYLLDNQADPNIVEKNLGDAPLIIAASKGNRKLIELLLKHGADTNAITKAGSTALHAAAKNFALEGGDFGSIELLCSSGAKSCLDNFGHTPQDIIGLENPLSQTLDKLLTLNESSSLLGDAE